jgi:transcriptional regulator with XRE-family HTH domain
MNAQNSQPSVPNELSALRAVVGRNIKAARENAGLDEQDLCHLTGISHLYLHEIENGTCNILLNDIANISAVLGVAPDDLVNPRFRPADNDGSVVSSRLPAENPSLKKT